MTPDINTERLLTRLNMLAEIGLSADGELTRLALSDEDAAARDLIVHWMQETGAEVWVDQIGNIHGVIAGEQEQPAICTGSHIDTVNCAGKLDGCYGVLAGIEILQTIKDQGLTPGTPIEVIVLSNEEGVRFTPDLLGSRVMVKDISLSEALAAESRNGDRFGSELKRLGYDGERDPWHKLPGKFLELHIEQGPVLESTGNQIGVVEAVQGHSWWQIDIHGSANHAGTTPMNLRLDAGQAAMSVAQHITEMSTSEGIPAVATIGTFSLGPGSINVVPGHARFTLDFRDANAEQLRQADIYLHKEARQLEQKGFTVSLKCLSRAEPVFFSSEIATAIRDAASKRTSRILNMISGASHDAQMIARICPTAMIFVPSVGGISHNPAEFTHSEDLATGAQVLADVIWKLAK